MKSNKKHTISVFGLILILTFCISTRLFNPTNTETEKANNPIDENNTLQNSDPPDDNYEENDDPSTATNLISYENEWLSDINGYGIQADDDFYLINAPGGETLYIDCLFSHAEGNIDIILINILGEFVAAGVSIDDNESIIYSVPSTGYFLIAVIGDNMGNQYDLRWNTSLVGLIDDNYEDNDFYLSAYDLTLHENEWLNTINGYGIQYEDDWYEIYAIAGDILYIDCLFSHAAGNIDIGLANSAPSLIATNASQDDDEHLMYSVTITGTYFIVIVGDNIGNQYDLRWYTTWSGTDDNYEENDEYTLAYNLTLHENEELSEIDDFGVQADDDWYEIYVTSGDILYVDCFFIHSEGDINIEIYDSSGINNVDGSYSTSDDEYISYSVSITGTYFILVFGSNNGNQYNLKWYTGSPTDDNYEDNDDPYSAYNLISYENMWLSEIDGYGIQADDDWYMISANVGETIYLDCLFSHAAGNVDLALLNSSGYLVAAGISLDDDERIVYLVPSTDTYLIYIFGDNIGTQYDFKWEIGTPPVDDNYEENDAYTTAYNLTLQENEWLNAIDGYGIQYDDDWYEIYATAGDFLYIDCLFTHSGGNIDLGLVNVGYEIIAASVSLDDDEHIVYSVSTTGTYFIVIVGDNIGNQYDLRWNITEESSIDDDYEENDIYLTAYDLTLHENEWLNSINGYGIQADDDWYEIYASAGETLFVDCLYSHMEGDINIALINSELSAVAYSTTTSDEEHIIFSVPATETYYILVFGDNNENQYNLRWYIGSLTDDNYEDNDDPYSAYNLTLHENEWLNAINGFGIQYDDDWYEICASAGETLYIDCLFSHMDGDINIILVDSGLTPVAYSTTTSDNEHIVYEAADTEIYYILVIGDNLGTQYDLQWYIGVPIIDDNYEENEDYTSAYDLTSHENEWLNTIDSYGIQYDDDWYEIYASAGETLYINCLFSHEDGDIDIALYDSAPTVVDYSISTSDDEYIIYSVSATGTYYILVMGDNMGNQYDLQWYTTGGGPTDDNYEENDAYTTAYNLTSQENVWLHTIDGYGIQANDDWYEIYATTGETLYIDCLFSHAQGNIDIRLYDSVGITVLAISDSVTDDENIVYSVPTAGIYYIRIYGDDAGNQYDLIWYTTPPLDDNYEENDDYISAYNLTLHENEWLNNIDGYGIQGDNDWYEIFVSSEELHLVLELNFISTEGYLNISIYNGTGVYIIGFDTITDNITINYWLSLSGTYYILVSGEYLLTVYNLRWNIDNIPQDTEPPSGGGGGGGGGGGSSGDSSNEVSISGYDTINLIGIISGVSVIIVIIMFKKRKY